MRNTRKSVLLKTSSISDVQHGGGILSITGCLPVRVGNILDIKQIKYKAEVQQVVKIGYSGYTPTANTKYTAKLEFMLSTREGYTGVEKTYSYETPAVITTIGATAALQREFIHAKIIAQITADHNRNQVPATAVTLAGGTGISITDDAGYYPARKGGASNGRKGPTNVVLVTNADGSGWVNLSTENIVTTAGVISFGEGQRLADDAPILAAYTQNLTSGELYAPVAVDGTFAVPGQHYDAFIISSLQTAAAMSITDQLALVSVEQAVFVDNGTGSATTNLTGFVAFEKAMLRELFGLYVNDPSSVVDFFDQALVASATYPTTGAAISTTDNVVMAAQSTSGSKSNTWYVNPIGTHTLLTPIVAPAVLTGTLSGGIQPYLDVVTQEGVELSVPNAAQNPKQFIVGKTEFSLYCKLNIGAGIAATDFKSLSIGFRKKAAYAVDQTAYEAASVATAALGVPLDTGVAPVFNMITGPGSAGALTNTSTTVAPAVSSTHDFLITVGINGVVKFYVDGVDKTSLLAASYTFAAGTVLMPFVSFRHGANAGATPQIMAIAALPTAYWRL